jgi:hypothetical protein
MEFQAGRNLFYRGRRREHAAVIYDRMKPIIERDPVNKRTVAMWDECGMRFRANIVEPGGKIEMHAHSYAHVAAVHGNFRLTTISPGGKTETRTANRKETIEAGWRHGFDYLDDKDVGEVLCFWPIGHDGGV